MKTNFHCLNSTYNFYATWKKKKKGKTSKFVTQEVRTGMREKGHGMDRQGRMEKRNVILVTERCENINAIIK